jgi:sterol desaturase/sphingolipid hydroxylase (fatty acid hydroxylase superfamily)
METYAAILLWAIPAFLLLVLLEIVYGHFSGKQTYSFMDTLASLSSGMTNILKDIMGLTVVLISYPYLLQRIQLQSLEAGPWTYCIAFICIDFASYWGHRLNHHINLFWNQHIIHHSSEEFNLACALRQSFSNLISLSALFLIPAALLGVPAEVITLLAPLHLFGQFWYHTQHIGKLGWLEYILVTPSQHRVHHAINPEYIDKNLAAIFCIWDRLFGTFQEELEEVPPVYGTLKPVRSWNPFWINFQHLWALVQDAWRTTSWSSKFKIWFMPTGWRPEDVALAYPREYLSNPFEQKKYKPYYPPFFKVYASFQFVGITFMLLYFLSHFGSFSTSFQLSYVGLLFLCLFAFTAVMDCFHWASLLDGTRALLGLGLLALPTHSFLWESHLLLAIWLALYFGVTFLMSWRTAQLLPTRKMALS